MTEPTTTLITAPEALALLEGKIADNAFYWLLQRGEVPGQTRLGRKYLIRTATFLRWLRGGDSGSLHRADLKGVNIAH